MDPINGRLPDFVVEIKGNNVVKSRLDLAPQAEEGGAFAPTRGILVAWQENPQDLMYGDQGTFHDLHVPSMRRCRTMETQGGDRKENQPHSYPL